MKERGSTRIFEGTLADAERQIEGVSEVTGVLKRLLGKRSSSAAQLRGLTP